MSTKLEHQAVNGSWQMQKTHTRWHATVVDSSI